MLKRFISKVFCFVALITILLVLTMVFVPSPEMSNSLLVMSPVKQAMLRGTPSPKVILVGGSNLSHGLNSQVIHETYKLPVVNMGLHGGLGLFFMMQEVRCHVAKGDILVMVPEYSQFTTEGFYGNKEVLGVVFDIMPEQQILISRRQWVHLSKYLPNYAARKLVNGAFRSIKRKRSSFDVRKAYNKFGDSTEHLEKNGVPFIPAKPVNADVRLSSHIFKIISDFIDEIHEAGARVVILPPCFQATSFDNTSEFVSKVEKEMRRRGFPLLVPMKRYRMEDCLFYDTAYHLNKQGVDIRTDLLIRDLVKILNPNTGKKTVAGNR